MNLDEIKEIIEADGGKFIIVENGKPTLVVASFEDYKEKLNRGLGPDNPRLKKEKILPREDSSLAPQKEELTIEDLPV